MDNPYPFMPVEGESFVGRERDYKRLRKYLEGKSCIIIVTGERGIGKTSFLRNVLHREFPGLDLLFIEYRTEKQFESGFAIPDLYRRIEKESRTKIDTLKELLKKLDSLRMTFRSPLDTIPVEVEKSPGAFTGDGDVVRLNYQTVVEIQNFLKKIDQKVVVLIENAHNLFPAEQKVLDSLMRSLNFHAVLEVPSIERDKIEIRDCIPLDLGRLSREESLRIIEKGHFPEDVSRAVYDISEGNPYYLQSICWVLYDTYGGDVIGMSSFVETLRGKKFKDRLDYIHKEILNTLSEESHSLVKDLSIAPFLMTHRIIEAFTAVQDVDGALSPLINKEIVLERDGLFFIYHSLFREFLRSDQRNRIALELEHIYVKAAICLKKEADSLLLFYELREEESILKKLIPIIENEDVLLRVGNGQFDRGRWDIAKSCFERGFDLGGPQRPHFIGSLGIISYSRGELDNASEYFKTALDIDREIGYKQGEASDLGNIGVIYSDKGDLDEALKYHKEALDIHREIGYKQGEASDLGNIGLIYRNKGDLDEALKYLKEALDIFSTAAPHLTVKTVNNIAIVYFRNQNYEKGFESLAKALSSSSSIEQVNEVFFLFLRTIRETIEQNKWEDLEKIHITYTSGILKDETWSRFFRILYEYAQYKRTNNGIHRRSLEREREGLNPTFRKFLDELLEVTE